MPALFLQLRRNTRVLAGTPTFPPRPDIEPRAVPPRPSTGSAAGSRITFAGSRLVFQYYPGSGLQIQPLAQLRHGERARAPSAGASRTTCDRDGAARSSSTSWSRSARTRGGFTTWEYWFRFGGGTPPWTSGMSQGTAIQALTRAASRACSTTRRYLRLARAGARRLPASARRWACACRRGGGSHYLLYSFSPGLRVLNGFLQAITGLYDYARIAGDSTRARCSSGRASPRAASCRRYDTGAWSLYSQGGAESTGGYHSLVTGFLAQPLLARSSGRYCRYRRRASRATDERARARATPAPAQRAGGRALRDRLHASTRCRAWSRGSATASGRAGVSRAAQGRRAARARSPGCPRRRGRYKLTLDARDCAQPPAGDRHSARSVGKRSLRASA